MTERERSNVGHRANTNDRWVGAINMSPAVVSAIAAPFAVLLTAFLAWRTHVHERNAYLVLALTLERASESRLIVHTSLDNRSKFKKYVEGVRLIVCPASEVPVDAANVLLAERHEEISDHREIATWPLTGPLSDGERFWMPLPYYTEENRWVADEVLTCDAVIDVSTFEVGVAYSVRLILLGQTPKVLGVPFARKRKLRRRLFRVVHKGFVR
jgi:hypothetical protein